jgi:23S rRNA (cytidine1920-2'-O)/16S rRNA (cytidine1409-2'-O)-methyltransferase
MTPKVKTVRLDDLLLEQGLFNTRDEIVRSVIAREVRVNDVYVTSAALKVRPDADIFIKGRKQFVSRGGHKLQGALTAFKQDVATMNCLDIGSSTGGFTDCLLQAGASRVVALDVNYGQLAWKIRQNERVVVAERTNIKEADPALLGAPFDLIVIDVSFIGLAALCPYFPAFCKPGTLFIGLVKPQFESAHEETVRGVVTDEAVRLRTVEEVKAALVAQGFTVTGVVESSLKGPEGNVEYLVRAVYEPSILA